MNPRTLHDAVAAALNALAGQRETSPDVISAGQPMPKASNQGTYRFFIEYDGAEPSVPVMGSEIHDATIIVECYSPNDNLELALELAHHARGLRERVQGIEPVIAAPRFENELPPLQSEADNLMTLNLPISFKYG